MSVRNAITAETEKTTSLERAVKQSDPKLSLMQVREHIEHVLAKCGQFLEVLQRLPVEHGHDSETHLARRSEWSADKAPLMLRAKSGQPRPDETSDDPEKRRLARALIAFTTLPGFDGDERRTCLTKRGRQ
jgi:hypothetical protein